LPTTCLTNLVWTIFTPARFAHVIRRTKGEGIMANTPSKPTSTTKRKAAATKAAAGKPAARRKTAPASNPPTQKATASKIRVKKSPVKKPAAPKTVTASKAKTVKKAAIKKGTVKKSAAKPASKVSLQAQLDAVTKRLTAADRKTQKQAKHSLLAASPSFQIHCKTIFKTYKPM